MEEARRTIGSELQNFARNTLEYIVNEALITFEPLQLPPLRVRIEGRHVLVVVRGHDYEHDLKALRPYVREYQPVMIAVDGGADALLALKLRPDVIIGDFDSLSERAMHCGASVSRRNATAQPASAPSRYAVGLGARFAPPSRAGRSASQLNGPADRRARPFTSVAVTVGRVRALAGSARNTASVSAIVVVIMSGSSVRPST